MSQATELRALLSKLSQHIGSSHDENASLRLLTRAERWRETVVAAAEAGGGSVLSPSDLGTAGERLDRIAGRLTAAWAALPSSGGIVRVKVWQLCCLAACVVAEGCASVIDASSLPRTTFPAFRRSVALLLGPGRLLLDHFGAGWTSDELVKPTVSILTQLRLMYLLATCVSQCTETVHHEWTAQLAPPPAVVAWLEAAAAAAAGLPPPGPFQTGAALTAVRQFEATLAAIQERALPYIVLQLTHRLNPCAAEAKAEVAKIIAELALVVNFLIAVLSCRSYAAAIALSDSLPANLVTLLVPAIHQAAVVLQLPPERRSQWGWCTWCCAADMAGILSSNELADALKEHLCPPAQPSDDDSDSGEVSSNAQRLLTTACQLMAHVPFDMIDQTPIMLDFMLHAFEELMASVCWHIHAALAPAVWQQLVYQVQDYNGVWQQGARYPRLAQQLVQVLPRLPATLQLLMEGGPLRDVSGCVVGVSGAWSAAVCLLQTLQTRCPTIVSSWSELLAWCKAITALLKGQALTAELAGQYESQPTEQDALLKLDAALSQSIFHLASGAIAFAEKQHIAGFDAPLPGAIVAAAETALWHLHTAQCRSAHRQAADRDEFDWNLYLDSTNQTLLTAWRLHQCVQQGVSQPFGRHGAAMAAAHCQMLQAVVCDAGRLEASMQPQLTPRGTPYGASLASAIAVCGAMCPAVLMRHLALVDLQHQALVAVGGKAAAASPRVTAHMLASGAMDTMLQQLESSGAQGAALLGAQDGSLAGLLAAAYQALVQAADDVLSAASGGSTAIGTEELQAAQQTLKAVLDSLNADLGVSGGGQPSTSAAAAAVKVLREEAQPAAGQLAAALLVLWTQPDQRKQAALELAQASAARSCAYLSCSNVCGGDGPAAGQGVGSKRCSQCHTSYYCGTACAHADWRQGGHGRVCKALAGTWQAAQQQ
ncbi:hypothetical protein ACK3TF_004058 [Chlorella vulgaris]